MILIYVYIAIYLLQAPFIYAMAFANFQGQFPNIAESKYREDAAFSVLFALWFSALPVIGIAFVFLLTAFAEYGLKWK